MAELAAVGAGLGILGSVGSTIGKVQAADAQSKSLEAEARSLELQAGFAETQQRRQARLLTGEANARAAASGVDLSSGSPLLMELDRAKQSEIEALNIRRSGQMGAAAKRYESKMVKRSIPYSILGGVGQSGSILSSYMAR